MGEAKRRRESAGIPAVRQATVNFPKPLYDRMERIRPGVKIGGRVPDTGEFVAFLVERMLDMMMQAAEAQRRDAEAKERKNALVKTPAEIAQEIRDG